MKFALSLSLVIESHCDHLYFCFVLYKTVSSCEHKNDIDSEFHLEINQRVLFYNELLNFGNWSLLLNYRHLFNWLRIVVTSHIINKFGNSIDSNIIFGNKTNKQTKNE